MAARVVAALASAQSLVQQARDCSEGQEQDFKQQMEIVVSSGVRTSEMVGSLHQSVCSLRKSKHRAERDNERLFASLCKLQSLAFVTHSACARLGQAEPVGQDSGDKGHDSSCGRGCQSETGKGDDGGGKLAVEISSDTISRTLSSSERAAAGLEKSIAMLKCPALIVLLKHAAGQTMESGIKAEGSSAKSEDEDGQFVCTGELLVDWETESLGGYKGHGVADVMRLRHREPGVGEETRTPHRRVSLLNSPSDGKESCGEATSALPLSHGIHDPSPLSVSQKLPSLSPSFSIAHSPSPNGEETGHGNNERGDVNGHEGEGKEGNGATVFVRAHSLKLLRISDTVKTSVLSTADPARGERDREERGPFDEKGDGGVRVEEGGSDDWEGSGECAAKNVEILGIGDHDHAELLRLEEEKERAEWERTEREWERRREREWRRKQEEVRDGEKERMRDLEVDLEITAVHHLLSLLAERLNRQAFLQSPLYTNYTW
jgi:hypothetical protein